MRVWNENVDVTFADNEATVEVRHEADYDVQVPYVGYQVPVQFGEAYVTLVVHVRHIYRATRDKVEELAAEYGVVNVDYGDEAVSAVLIPGARRRVYRAAGRAYGIEDVLTYQVVNV